MPALKRSKASTTKKICIEIETPLIPKSKNNDILLKNRKRKLDQDFSPKSNAHQLQSKKSVQERYITNGKEDTQKVHGMKKETANNHKVTLCRETYQLRNKKIDESMVVNPLNQTEDLQEITNTGSKNYKNNSNEKRVNKAIENISKRSNQADDIHQCSTSKIPGDCENTKEKKSDIELETDDDDEDYQRKYFRLLDVMKSSQKEFLMSQQDFEQQVAANDDFVEGMKGLLEEKSNELLSTREELERCKAQNVDLENCKRVHEVDIEALNTKVKEMTNNVLAYNQSNEKEEILKGQIEDQRSKLELYKTLTSLSLENDKSSSAHSGGSMCQTFICSIKQAEPNDEIRFVLTQDREFAEIEYRPMVRSPETNQHYIGFPAYLQEQIFFADEQAPKFLLRLLQTLHEPGEK